jgi:hypothetical protein
MIGVTAFGLLFTPAFYQPVSKVETSLRENVLTLRLVYGNGHAEEQGAAGAVVVRK